MGLLDEIKNESYPVIASPLAGYHDPPQARIFISLGLEHMIYPFVSSDGIMRRKQYRDEVTLKLKSWEANIRGKDFHVQIFGSNPGLMSDAASYLEEEIGVEIINLNMGCSVRKVWKNGSGSLLLKDLKLARSIIESVCSRVRIPVTLKTRTGWDRNDENGLELISQAHELGISVSMLHPRRGKDQFNTKAEWSEIAKAVELSKIPLIGNGDIKTPIDARNMINETGVKGVMIGRASIGNPWIFPATIEYLKSGRLLESPSPSERIDLCLCHIDELVKFRGETLGIKECRKHIGRYLKGLPDAVRIRMNIVTTDKHEEVRQILKEYKESIEKSYV